MRMFRPLRLALLPLVLSAAVAAQPAKSPTPEELRGEAFVAAQYAQITAAAAAVDRVSARLSAGGGALSTLEQERDSKLAEIEGLERQFVAQLERGTTGAAAGQGDLAARRTAARDQLNRIDARIEREFPQYFELTRPRPLSLQDTQALLNPDEALLLALVLDDATYVWAVTREGATWARADTLGIKALQGKVDQLRTSMRVPNSRGTTFDEAAPARPAPGVPAGATAGAFDRKLAHEIYLALIKPVEPLIAGKKVLLTNMSGPLTALPLSLLVTATPTGSDDNPADLAATGWLGDRYAMAELPAVSSLRALRCLLIARREEAHRGCKTIAASPAYARKSSIALAGFGAPLLDGPAKGAAKSLLPAVYRGGLANPAEIRRLAPLPYAAAELASLGKVFGSRAVIVSGAAATEAAVKRTGALGSARFLVFSTHGLLASEIGSAVEPGLVFTPPAIPSTEDDGLLTASEAAQLRIAADLAVLSACNTAASNGKEGAEGLSGLARAFLFAGARSLLVSHWPVSDSATSLLMEQTFNNIEAGGDVAARAKALQAAMKSVRNEGTGSFASPQYWAAFTLVGDPGR